ncbi:MAG: hypothetical protein JNG84_03670 [Archangium sp.]|nr:hypothetical protein [Archangium sp.]
MTALTTTLREDPAAALQALNDKATTAIRERPLTALLSALAVGYIFGRLVMR